MSSGSILDRVNVHEAGAIYIVSGRDRDTVRYAMKQLEADGALNVTEPARVGDNWIATFTNPLFAQCSVERQGYRIEARGPTPEILTLYAAQFVERGAVPQAAPVQEEDHWVLYLLDEAERTGAVHF